MKNTRFKGILLAGAISLAACSPVVTTHGNFIDDQELQAVAAGVTTKSTLQSQFGPPSAVAPFNPNIWYYIGQVNETEAFGIRETVDRRVIEVTFDKQDRVTSIVEKSLEDGKDIAITDQTTPTYGNEYSLLQQLVGNIGRFNTTDDAAVFDPAGGNAPGPGRR
jgi:outer membrane protein assembly factor BamE (lipoprotein component of BamABCDE complex)